MGTPSYMSPEQVKGRAVDGRSDIFSLGVMLYEMVTGEKPFPGQNITTVIYKIVNEEAVPPRQINPSIHAGISTVVMRALEKDPDQRYQSCREMLEDLRNYRSIAPGGNNPQSTMVLGEARLGDVDLRESRRAWFCRRRSKRRCDGASLSGRASTPDKRRSCGEQEQSHPLLNLRRRKVSLGLSRNVAASRRNCLRSDKIRPVFEAARELVNEQKKGGSLPPAVPAGSETLPSIQKKTLPGQRILLSERCSCWNKCGTRPAESKPAEIVAEKGRAKETGKFD